MRKIIDLTTKPEKLVIGLMSGTCTDGIDAALVKIKGFNTGIQVDLVDFITLPYPSKLRSYLLELASGTYGGSYEISRANFLLGHLFADACIELCKQSNTTPSSIDLIGSHGHTIYHQPIPEALYSHNIKSTLQIGEAAVISEKMGTPVVADFRVRDIAANGLGAPLVPYTEFLLYSSTEEDIALQNIGGIGNITYLPSNNCINDVLAFDTGPGNMIIDSLVSLYTNNTKNYDESGKIAAKGSIHLDLLDWLLQDTYIHSIPPKTTGREHYGSSFVTKLLNQSNAYNLSFPDLIATATMFTAKSIEINIKNHLPNPPQKLIIGGGGSYNNTLLKNIKSCLPWCNVITNEDLGLNGNAKEAIAFAILANEYIFCTTNNVPCATGAIHPVVMGKLTL